MTATRLWLLFLRRYWSWRERCHIRMVAECESRRRSVLSRLRMLDAPKPYSAPRYQKIIRLFWEA